MVGEKWGMENSTEIVRQERDENGMGGPGWIRRPSIEGN